MTINDAIRNLMLANSTISGLASLRLYPEGSVPQKAALPYGTYATERSEPLVSLSGITGVTVDTVRIDWYSATAAQAQALISATQTALHCYYGTVIIDLDSLRIQSVFQDSEESGAIDIDDGGDSRVYHGTSVYVATYEG